MIFQGEKIRVEVTPFKDGEAMPGIAVDCNKIEVSCEYEDILNSFGQTIYRRKVKTILTIFHVGASI